MLDNITQQYSFINLHFKSLQNMNILLMPKCVDIFIT